MQQHDAPILAQNQEVRSGETATHPGSDFTRDSTALGANSVKSLGSGEFIGRKQGRVAEVGALDQWRRELRAGVAGQRADRMYTWHFDYLWEAACAEANGRDFDRMGLVGTGDSYRLKARDILNDAAREVAA